MHRDAREPGRETRAAFELVQVLVRAHEGVLHHVFGFAVVAQDGPGRAVHARVVAPHQLLEQRQLSGADPSHISSSVSVGEAMR